MPLLPQVGVSACLAGERVRYDGDSRPALALQHLQGLVRLWHFCPEMAIGLGVPRPPIQVVRIHNEPRVQTVAAPHRDVTDALSSLVHELPADLAGFILKARSPSCGTGSTPVFAAGTQVDTGDGAFAAALRSAFPDMPLIDEEALAQAELRQAFVTGVLAYSRKSAPR